MAAREPRAALKEFGRRVTKSTRTTGKLRLCDRPRANRRRYSALRKKVDAKLHRISKRGTSVFKSHPLMLVFLIEPIRLQRIPCRDRRLASPIALPVPEARAEAPSRKVRAAGAAGARALPRSPVTMAAVLAARAPFRDLGTVRARALARPSSAVGPEAAAAAAAPRRRLAAAAAGTGAPSARRRRVSAGRARARARGTRSAFSL